MQHELSADEARLTYLLFPCLRGLELDQVEDVGDLVRLVARHLITDLSISRGVSSWVRPRATHDRPGIPP